MCRNCEAGPSGIIGHEQLFSHIMSAREMHFTCRDCGDSWSRRSNPGGYAWERIERPTGLDVPGRPGTTPP